MRPIARSIHRTKSAVPGLVRNDNRGLRFMANRRDARDKSASGEPASVGSFSLVDPGKALCRMPSFAAPSQGPIHNEAGGRRIRKLPASLNRVGDQSTGQPRNGRTRLRRGIAADRLSLFPRLRRQGLNKAYVPARGVLAFSARKNNRQYRFIDVRAVPGTAWKRDRRQGPIRLDDQFPRLQVIEPCFSRGAGLPGLV